MRVTNSMIGDATVAALQQNLESLSQLEKQLTTGKRINQPSDDPPAVEVALSYQTSIAAGQQYLRNISSGTSWLQMTDSTLSSATSLLQRARELAVQGANDTLATSDQADMASEVDQLLQQMVQLGNSGLQGQRLFAGLKTDADPFTLNAGPPTTVVYSGDNGQMQREIDTGATMTINTPGSAVFGPAFTALINLRDHLQAGDSAAVRTNDLSSLDAALNTMITARATTGAKLNRLQAAQTQLQQSQAQLAGMLATVQDTDYAAAISNFQQQSTVYQASLQAAAKMLQPSLLDYLS